MGHTEEWHDHKHVPHGSIAAPLVMRLTDKLDKVCSTAFGGVISKRKRSVTRNLPGSTEYGKSVVSHAFITRSRGRGSEHNRSAEKHERHCERDINFAFSLIVVESGWMGFL